MDFKTLALLDDLAVIPITAVLPQRHSRSESISRTATEPCEPSLWLFGEEPVVAWWGTARTASIATCTLGLLTSVLGQVDGDGRTG
jgi:hypothetical protein